MLDGWIRFMAPVLNNTADALIRAIDEKLSRNIDRLHVMLSTPGGSVFHGLSIHNLLRGLPIPVTTYNFGSVDSIGVVIFCAGTERVCVPHARFLIHNVSFNFQGQIQFDSKKLEEQLKLLKSDHGNIAKVIADASGKTISHVDKMMDRRTTLHPEEARKMGLVTDVRSKLFPEGSSMTMIYEDGTKQELVLAPNQLPLAPESITPMAATSVSASLSSVSSEIPMACSVYVNTGTYFERQ